MNECAVGIDVSKKKLEVCVATGDKIKTKVFKNTAAGHADFNRWLSQRALPARAWGQVLPFAFGAPSA